MFHDVSCCFNMLAWCNMIFEDVSYGVSWWLLNTDVSWCLICLIMFYDVSWCFMFHNVVRCCKYVSWWSCRFKMCRDVWWCFKIFQDVSWCFMLCHDVSQCVMFMMFQDISWYFMMCHDASSVAAYENFQGGTRSSRKSPQVSQVGEGRPPIPP